MNSENEAEAQTWDDDFLKGATTPDEDPFTFGSGELEGQDAPAPLNEETYSFDEDLPALVPAAAPAFDSIGEQPIPRIRISAFCDRTEVAKSIRVAGEDRRMARTELSVDEGGLEGAIGMLSTQASPNLIIIDTALPAPDLLLQLDRLADHVDEGAKVLIIGAANDIALYRELMRRGVSEYLVAPVQPLQLIHSIATLYVNPDKPFAGRVIGVIGAKGGVGSSTLAHNLAWCLAEKYAANTTLVDFDLPFGTTALDFNQDPTQTVAEALMSPDRVDEVFLERLLVRQSERLMLFCAPASVDREFEIENEAFEIVIDRVRRGAPYIVLDLPHLWTPWMRNTLVSADDVIIVATPELASLRNAKNMIDRVKGARPNDAPPTIVLNMQGVPKRPEIPLKDFGEAIGIEPTHVIPFEPQLFGTAANNGQMIGEAGVGSKVAFVIESMAGHLCGRQPAAPKKSSLLENIPFLKR